MLIGSYIPAEDQLYADTAIEVQLGRQLLNDCCLLPPSDVSTSVNGIQAYASSEGPKATSILAAQHGKVTTTKPATHISDNPGALEGSYEHSLKAFDALRLEGSLPSQQYPARVTSGCRNLVLPRSVFDSFTRGQDSSPHVIITFCKPQNNVEGLAAFLPMPEVATASHELSPSPSPSECIEEHNMPWRKSSGSSQLPLTASSSPPATASSSDARETVPGTWPTVETGSHLHSASTPNSAGGKRVLRTAEERKAHRMAKNRATAAASRQRRQKAKQELLTRQQQLSEDNARLLELLSDRDAQIEQIQQHIQLTASGCTPGSFLPHLE